MAEGSSILRIAGRRYVAGLDWQVAASASTADARAAARRADRDLYVVHTAASGRNMHGFAAEGSGVRIGLPSLASAMAANHAGEWIAALRIPSEGNPNAEEAYYVVAAQSGAIEPRTDKIVRSKGETYRESPALRQSGLAQAEVFAPPEVGIQSASDLSWDEFLQRGGALNRLKPASYLRFYRWGAYAAGALLVAAAGWAVVGWLREPGDEAAARVDVPAPPWANVEQGAAAARRCLQGFSVAPAIGPGWRVQSMACAGGEVSTVLKADSSVAGGGNPFQWLSDALEHEGWPLVGLQWQVAKDPKLATYTASVPTAPVWPASLRPAPSSAVIARTRVEFNERFVDVEVGATTGTFYRSTPVTFKTRDDPQFLIGLLDDITGLTLQSITFDNRDYTLSFVIHEIGQEPDPSTANYLPPKPARTFDTRFSVLYRGDAPK